MDKSSVVVSRRLVLKGTLGAAMVAALPTAALAKSSADAMLLTISDLHAPYVRLPALLETFKSLRADSDVPMAALINGDIFERGNVVCQRSGGVADWAFLSELAAEMPVVVNLGNHETAILDDMNDFVALAERAGVQVISNLKDRRSGDFFAPVSARLELGEIDLALLGLATTNPYVYRKTVRETLEFADTTQFVKEALPEAGSDADLSMIMSHAGLNADKGYLGDLPAGTVVQGAHDHLDIDVVHNGIPYFHGSSWGTQLGLLSLTKSSQGVKTEYSTKAIAPYGGDEALADIIEAQKTEHLTEEDKEVIADIPKALDMHHSILLATEAIRDAAEADVAMIGHTTFGQPLAAGPLSRYDFNAFVRFGGGLKLAEVSGETLAVIMSRSNQFAANTLDARSGDYVHVAELDIDPTQTYRLVVNGWTAKNQRTYLGTDDLAFADVDGLELKAVVAGYLGKVF